MLDTTGGEDEPTCICKFLKFLSHKACSNFACITICLLHTIYPLFFFLILFLMQKLEMEEKV